MNESIRTLSDALELKLGNLIPKIAQPEKFIECCDEFVKANEKIRPLPFCSFLRKKGFKIEAKVICQYFILKNPGALTRTLAA